MTHGNAQHQSVVYHPDIYIALLGILFVPFTMRVGLYRVKNEIIIGDGKDEELIRRIRGQGNFV